MQAEVLRIIYGPEGAIKPGGDPIDITDWLPQNVRALEQDGRIRVSGPAGSSGDVEELQALCGAQADRIAEMTAKMVKADLIFDAEVHISEKTKSRTGAYRRKAGRKAGSK